MKKVAFSLVLIALCASAFAGTYTHPTVSLAPITNVGTLAGNVLDIPVGYVGAVDPITKIPVIDPVTGLQVQEMTFAPMLAVPVDWWTTGKAVFESATLVKHHEPRKSVCQDWCDAGDIIQPPVTVPATPAIKGIRVHWPLMFETNGTSWTLTVNYHTTKAFLLPTTALASKEHTEVFKWVVVANTFADLDNAIKLFYKVPAGQCELPFITGKNCYDLLNWYIFTGSPAGTPGFPAIGSPSFSALATAKDKVNWDVRWAKFVTFLQSMCWAGCCSGGSGTDPCDPGPSASMCGIIDTCSAPVASIILTDLWEAGKAAGIMSKTK